MVQVLHGRQDSGSIRVSTKEFHVTQLKDFLRDESGQDMVEYAVLAAFVSIVAIATIKTLGPLVTTIYTNVVNALQ